MSAAAIPSFDEFSKKQANNIPSFEDFSKEPVPPTREQTPIGDRPVSMASITEVPRIMGGQAIEGAKGAIKGLARSAYNVGSMALNPFGMNPVANAIENKTHIGEKINRITSPSNTAQTIGGYIPDAAMLLAPGGALEEGGKLLPNVASAGRKFETVAKAVGSNPVNIDAAAPAALRAAELKASKFTTPPVMSRILQRLSPGAEPVGFREASDLATNTGSLSAAERMSIKGPMQRQVSIVAKALREANQGAADAAGVGDVYKSAVGEYRRAMKLGDAKDVAIRIAKKYVLPAAAAGVGGAAGYKAARIGLGD